jgi:hypothetical protein
VSSFLRFFSHRKLTVIIRHASIIAKVRFGSLAIGWRFDLNTRAIATVRR